MDGLNPLAVPLLPVTKTWVFSIVAMSAATSMNMVKPIKLIFFPSRILTEPWRLITGFCFFGQLHFSLIQYLFIIARTNNSFEEQYLYKFEFIPHDWICDLNEELKARLNEHIEAKKTHDFAYFMARVATSIVFAIVVISRWYDISTSFYLLGPTLEKTVLYVLCRNMPSEYLQIMGISIKAKYAPFLTQFLEFVFSSEFREMAKLLRRNVYQAFMFLLYSNIARQALLVFTIGHMWWYIQFFHLSNVHDEFSTKQQEEWTQAYAAFRKKRPVLLDLPGFYRLLITPPWYYFIIRSLLKQQETERRRHVVVNGHVLGRRDDIPSGEHPETPGVIPDDELELLHAAEGSTGVNRNETVTLDDPRD